MASTNFRTFAESATDIMDDANYEIASQRISGVVPGIASAKLHNKMYKQATMMAAAIAQVIVQAGFDAKDTDYAALVANLRHSFAGSVGGNRPDAVGNIPITVNGNAPNSKGEITLPATLTLNQIYPVGCIYLTMTNKNPAEILGMGTWSQIEQGRFLRAGGSTLASGGSGGADSVTLGIDNMPNHDHTITVANGGTHSHSGSMASAGNHVHTLTVYRQINEGSSGTIKPESGNFYDNANDFQTSASGEHIHSLQLASAGDHNHIASASKVGGGKSFSILPPYYTVYMWYRTA